MYCIKGRKFKTFLFSFPSSLIQSKSFPQTIFFFPKGVHCIISLQKRVKRPNKTKGTLDYRTKPDSKREEERKRGKEKGKGKERKGKEREKRKISRKQNFEK